MSSLDTFHAALAAMKPIRCARCGRTAELPVHAVDHMRLVHRRSSPAELRVIALLGVFIDNWGLPVGASETDDPVCPLHATAEEHAHAGEAMRLFSDEFERAVLSELGAA